MHAGKFRGTGKDVWHAREDVRGLVYWCGNWGERSPEELFAECLTVMADLIKNHPGIETRKPKDSEISKLDL